MCSRGQGSVTRCGDSPSSQIWPFVFIWLLIYADAGLKVALHIWSFNGFRQRESFIPLVDLSHVITVFVFYRSGDCLLNHPFSRVSYEVRAKLICRRTINHLCGHSCKKRGVLSSPD